MADPVLTMEDVDALVRRVDRETVAGVAPDYIVSIPADELRALLRHARALLVLQERGGSLRASHDARLWYCSFRLPMLHDAGDHGASPTEAIEAAERASKGGA